MEWLDFDLVRVTDGYILLDIKYEARLTDESGEARIFASYDDANAYLINSDIRGSIRDVVDPAIN